MVAASNLQTSFLGGEWSKDAQGVSDDKRYKTALALCRNMIPLEEGALTRRPGTRVRSPTRGGGPGRLVNFDFTATHPYTLEFTDGYLRFGTGLDVVTENSAYVISNISSGDPALFTVATNSWATGDEILFSFGDEATKLGLAALTNRTFTIDVVSTTTFYARDPITSEPVNGITWSASYSISANRVLELETLMTDEEWRTTRVVRNLATEANRTKSQALLLNSTIIPQNLLVETEPTDTSFADFSLDDAVFLDGPYFDAVTGPVLTPSTNTGIVDLTLSYTAYSATTAYKAGDYVSSGGLTYISLQSANVNHTPASSATYWAVTTAGAAIGPNGLQTTDIGRHVRLFNATWTWGRITALTGTGSISGTMAGSANIGDMTFNGGLVAAFDGDATKTQPESATSAGDPAGGHAYIGKDYSGASDQTISSIRLTSPTTAGGYTSMVRAGTTFSVSLYASATLPANATAGTLLASQTGFDFGYSDDITLTSSDQATAWKYVWITFQRFGSTGPSNTLYFTVAQVQFYAASAAVGTVFSVELVGGNLPNTSAITVWRLGRYSETTGWPKVGAYHQGRLFLSGTTKNHFDASVSNDPFNFAPTTAAGTVTDNSAISYTLNAADLNEINWMMSTAEGLIMGTAAGEWLVQATANNAVLTPTNIQAHQHTAYKCADVEPVKAGMTIMFVQRFKRRLHEFLTDANSGKFFAPNMSVRSKHFADTGIEELAYQEETAPIVWSRMGDGSFAGMTYRRVSRFSSEDPIFFGWHGHTLGSGQLVDSIAVSASVDGALDALHLVARSLETGVCHVLVSANFPTQSDPLTLSMYLDDAVVPSCASFTSATNLRLYGLWHHRNREVTVFLSGIDCGDYTISNTGTVDLTLGTPVLLTRKYLHDVSTSGTDFADLAMPVDSGDLTIPCIVGYTYTSQGQRMRPVEPLETGAKLGPALAKFKRSNEYGVLLHRSINGAVDFGTTFSNMRPALLRTDGNRDIPKTTLYSGVHWANTEDGYSFDSQIAWQITRPYPTTIVALGAHIVTQG